MKTYTYSEARQKLASLLEQARKEGAVQIRRRDGQVFILQPVRQTGSPLDVPGVWISLRKGETRQWLAASRKEGTRRWFDEPSREVREKAKDPKVKASRKDTKKQR